MRKILITLAASLAATLSLTACGADDSTLVVGASPLPHAKILEFVRDNLAEEAGIEIEIREFDDYVLPNEALASGDIDANYFQHLPYLENQMEEKGYEFAHGEGVHIEPLTVFSDRHASVEDIPDGGTVVITNDVSNQYRGLKLLESSGLLTNVPEGATVLTLTDAENPKGLQFEETMPEVVVQQLTDPAVDAAVINANFLLNAGLKADDALAVEAVEGNPYANVLVWEEGTDNAAIATLDELLHSAEVADFIKQEWPNGDVIPGNAE